MKKLNIILRAGMIGLIFLTGFLSSYLLGYVYLNKESPFLIGVKSEKQPSEWLAKSKIQLYDNKIVINVDKAVISKYASTGSMMPVLGENANGIEIVPESPEQINVGDIISFNYHNMTIVHRVIDKGVDENGYWFVTKGDNNKQADGKVYWEDVKYVTIGVIY